MKLLHIDSSVLGPHSVSRQVSAAIVERLRQSTPGLDVSYRDLTLTPLAHLTGSHLAAGQGATPDASLRDDIAAGQAVLEEFLAADIVVIGAPMYNFTLPSQLKAWIDRVVVSGKTFKYGAQGAEGLAGNKRVIVAISRGGMVGNTVRVTSPSRSSPRRVKVSIRCEMPAIIRLISLKRRGPSPKSMITNTLHLSPTRARIDATARQSLSRWALGRIGPRLMVDTGADAVGVVTWVCSGFKNVRSCGVCGQSLI